MAAISQQAFSVSASLRDPTAKSCECGPASCSHVREAFKVVERRRGHVDKRGARMMPRAQASGNQGAQEAAFASVSTASPPAQQSSGVSGPAIGLGLAAGLIGGIGYAAVQKLIGGGSPTSAPPAPASIQAITPEYAASVASASVEKPVKQAAPAALVSIATHFPGSIQDELFVHEIAGELKRFGFTQQNSIAIVNTCRDEVCRPLSTCIDKELGLSFNLSGLGGLINSGKTGFKAAMSHSPEFVRRSDGKPYERYVFFAFPHISIGESGEVGSILRRGRGKPSSACGALIAIKNMAKEGPSGDMDPDDAEFVLLKNKVLASPLCKDGGPSGPSLVDVTKAALQVITEDLERLISLTVDPATADYAVVTGVQIHSGNQIPGEAFRMDRTVDYVAPGAMYAVVEGKRYQMSLHHSGAAPKTEATNGAVKEPEKIPVGANA